MPTDLARPSPPPDRPAPPSDSLQQEEALFRALLHRVQTSSDKTQLQDRCDAALRLVLNRDGDQSLRDELSADIHRLVAALPDDVSAGPGRVALAKATAAGLALLKMAEQRRLTPSSPQSAAMATVAASAASYERRAEALHHRHHHPAAAKPSPRYALLMMAALVALLAVGLVIGLHNRGADQAVRPLVVQMEAAAHGNVPATNIFGGGLQAAVQGGHTVVTVDGIPPGECISAGWDLVRKGLLTVNGVTPTRVSAAKLNELCHQEETATLNWLPKAAAQ